MRTHCDSKRRKAGGQPKTQRQAKRFQWSAYTTLLPSYILPTYALGRFLLITTVSQSWLPERFILKVRRAATRRKCKHCRSSKRRQGGRAKGWPAAAMASEDCKA